MKIIKEELLFKRYLKIWNRVVEYPNGKQIAWDIVGQESPAPHFACVFPYNTETKKVTILLEYAQGPNEMKYTLVAGGFEDKHSSIEDTARQELFEEAGLVHGELIGLSGPISEMKWGRNHFIPYLCLNPKKSAEVRNLDYEEFIEVLEVTVDELWEFILQGKMMLPSVQTSVMAIDYLKKHHLI